jgi:hypothetical protein
VEGRSYPANSPSFLCRRRILGAFPGVDICRNSDGDTAYPGNPHSPVSHYDAPVEFTGMLINVTVWLDDDQSLDGIGVGRAHIASE